MTYHISPSLLPGPSGEPQFGGDLEGLAAEVAEEDDHHAGHAQAPAGVRFNRHFRSSNLSLMPNHVWNFETRINLKPPSTEFVSEPTPHPNTKCLLNCAPGVECVVVCGDAVEGGGVVGVVVVERLHRLEDLRRLQRLLPLQPRRPRGRRVRLSQKYRGALEGLNAFFVLNYQ